MANVRESGWVHDQIRAEMKADALICKERQAKIASGEIPHPLEGLECMVEAAKRAPNNQIGYNRSEVTLADDDYFLEGN